ncbi:MAG: 50S ribosomal protein L9 [Bacilli bacterium]|jgi:large subunit ribosomal protein L9
MKVLMKEDVRKVGLKGQVVDVSDGYGANYLVPHNLAVLYTPAAQKEYLKQLEEERKQEEIKKNQAIEQAKQLESITLEFEAPAGRRGEMIGTVSFKEISNELKKKYDITIDKKQLVDKNVLVNGFGKTSLKVELYKGVLALVNVHVSLREKK